MPGEHSTCTTITLKSWLANCSSSQHWRRRFFRLAGPKLTAYHEHTHQKRAVINLSKASRLVDDKTMLVANPSPSKKNRRKSAFAEEDEGYAYVEEGFRVRFANGETIDFYADSKAKKDEWMEVLSQVVGKADQGARKMGWTDLVLAKERAGLVGSVDAAPLSPEKAGVEVKDFEASSPTRSQPTPWDGLLQRDTSVIRKPVGGSGSSSHAYSKSVPNSPIKSGHVPSHTRGAVQRPRTPPMKPRTGHRSRDAVKSMIF